MKKCRWRGSWAGRPIEVIYRTLPFADGMPSLGCYASGEIHVDGKLLTQVAADEHGAFDVIGMVTATDGSDQIIRASLTATPELVTCELRVAAELIAAT